jgi:hypothetical protein
MTSTPDTIWWDRAFRPVAMRDGNGTTKILRHDDYNRIVAIHLAQEETEPGAPEDILEENALGNNEGEALLLHYYTPARTWTDSVQARILTASGPAGWKTTANHGLDDIGRPEYVLEDYETSPAGSIKTTPTYTDAGLPLDQTIEITSGANTITLRYDFEYDDILRPERTFLTFGAAPERLISRLTYNAQDLVKTKYLAGALQKVDYYYDATGRLIAINSPGEAECFEDTPFCTLEAAFLIPYDTAQSVYCRYIEGRAPSKTNSTFMDC